MQDKFELRGRVTRGDTGESQSCMVRIIDSGGEFINPESIWYHDSYGFPCDGCFRVCLVPGSYTIELKCGIALVPFSEELDLLGDLECEFMLEPWYDFHANGWFFGEAHNHINYPVSPERTAAFIAGVGMDTISLCQGWSTYRYSSRAHDGEKLRKYLESASTERAKLYMGAEFPKTRFGHTCWWRFPVMSDPFGCYNNYHDTEYFRRAGISGATIVHPSSEIPFPDEAPIQKIERWKAQGGVSMTPHPTSWWMDNDSASLICTNIATDCCFALLAGKLFDMLVVMGYDADQIFYQNLWFNLLNEGYRIAACAETDGALSGHHSLGSLRSYVQTGNPGFDRAAFLRGLCRGNTFMTSGPILIAEDGNGNPPGTVCQHNGGEAVIRVHAQSDPDPDEFLSLLLLYRNGKLTEQIDLAKARTRVYDHEFKISMTPGERDWYVVKVYGSQPPLKAEFLDILEYCKLCEREPHTEYQELKQVAISNPFYFEPENWVPPAILTPLLRGTVRNRNGVAVSGISVRLYRLGEKISEMTTDADGVYQFDAVPLTSEIEIDNGSGLCELRSIYLHYPPLRDYFESIYSGKWALRNPHLKPGQVPWSVFRFRELRKLLSELNWDFQLDF